MNGDTETVFDPERSDLRFISAGADAPIHVVRTGAPTVARQAKYRGDELAERVDGLLDVAFALCGARFNGAHMQGGVTLTKMSQAERLCERCHSIMGEHAHRIFDGLEDDDLPRRKTTLSPGRLIPPRGQRDDFGRVEAELFASAEEVLRGIARRGQLNIAETLRRAVGLRVGIADHLAEGFTARLMQPTAHPETPRTGREVIVPSAELEADESKRLFSIAANAETLQALAALNAEEGKPPLGVTVHRTLLLYRDVLRNEQLGGQLLFSRADTQRELLLL